jgi:diguanylate cyclase (GGDEF)-like protein
MQDPFETRKMHTVPLAPTVPPRALDAIESDGPTHVAPAGHLPSESPAQAPAVAETAWSNGDIAVDRATDPALPVVPKLSPNDRATLTIISGINAGQVFAVDCKKHTLGRGSDADLWLEDGGVSRRHARITCRPDGRYFIEDLDSTNGTFIGSERVHIREIKPNDRIQLGPHVVLRFSITDDAEEELQRRLFESSTRDGLTRTYNRKYFSERMVAEVAYSRRHKVKLSVLMIDLDDFKRTTDTYGHLGGDMVLRAVSAQMQRLIRVEDILARYGGEEFVILARSTGKEDAVGLADRIRESISKLDIAVAEAPIRVTLSVGVAALPDIAPDGGPTDLLALADARLYKAKAAGKNRVCADGP